MGGEKIRICPPRPVWEGSPPHGRGKEIEPSTIARTVGITPAWAGKRSPASNSRPLLKDHPRMGGEKVPVAEQASNGKGSPPHGRGKDSAGYFWLEGSQDHPRMGGEKCFRRCTAAHKPGSPPHGRGKAATRSARSHSPGITPAWAGKSRKQNPRCITTRDHPRMGGEKCLSGSSVSLPGGSPPHGRGKVSRTRFNRDQNRITPAWAGKRAYEQYGIPESRDHPRMGGEKSIWEVDAIT